MNAVIIGTRCRHVNVFPVKVDDTNRIIVKTIAQRFSIGFKCVMSSTVVYSQNYLTAGDASIVDFDVAPARAN